MGKRTLRECHEHQDDQDQVHFDAAVTTAGAGLRGHVALEQLLVEQGSLEPPRVLPLTANDVANIIRAQLFNAR
jgi:hypothetical protein